MKKLYIPTNQLDSGQKAVNIIEERDGGGKTIAFNVTKDYAITLVSLYNLGQLQVSDLNK